MWLVGAFHAILELAVMFWQFFSDDVCAPWNVEGGSKKHSLTDLELIKRHDTPTPNHNIIYEIPGYPGYALRLLTRRASAGEIGAEALGVWDRRKARRRCMFSITAARRSASCFIANAISASRRSIRDAMLSFGSLSIGSGCFASSIIGRPCTRYPVISIQSPDCECSIRVGSIVALAFCRFQPSA